MWLKHRVRCCVNLGGGRGGEGGVAGRCCVNLGGSRGGEGGVAGRCCVNLGVGRGGEGGAAEAPREVLCKPGG